MDESQNNRLRERSHTVHAVWLHLYKLLENLNFSDRKQISSFLGMRKRVSYKEAKVKF